MKIFISAAEASSDAHGAELLSALKELAGTASIEVFGLAGPKLKAQGVREILNAEDFLAMGFVEVLGKLPKALRALSVLANAVKKEQPDVAILIDYPDFHMRLAQRLRNSGVPLISFIPPKVWAWRKGRLQLLKRNFARVLCILPFEADFYARSGVKARYVGNPLLDELPLSMNSVEARLKLGLEAQGAGAVITLMPGSRPAEFKYHLPLMRDTVARLEKLKPLSRILVPLPETVRDSQLQEVQRTFKDFKQALVFKGHSHEALLASDVALIKSGTSTLEAGLLRCPHVITFKPHPISTFIVRKMIRYRGPAGLENLILRGQGPETSDNPLMIPEFLSERARPELLAEALSRLLDTSVEGCKEREAQFKTFEKLHLLMKPPGALRPMQLAAQEVWSVLQLRGEAE